MGKSKSFCQILHYFFNERCHFIGIVNHIIPISPTLSKVLGKTFFHIDITCATINKLNHFLQWVARLSNELVMQFSASSCIEITIPYKLRCANLFAVIGNISLNSLITLYPITVKETDELGKLFGIGVVNDNLHIVLILIYIYIIQFGMGKSK